MKIIQTKVYLTKEGFDKIRKIRAGMNKGRYAKKKIANTNPDII